MDKIKLRQAVIVEGKYDKIRLASLLDTLIIDIGGFRIYKDEEKLALIRALAKTRGLIILTDSDRAGFQLRSYLGGSIPKEQITHVYIPDIHGKERRKAQPGKEGLLGVEGMDTETLKHLFDAFFSTKKGGSGLGLATVRKIIEAHNGRIAVQSEPNYGTQFTIILPSLPRLPEG